MHRMADALGFFKSHKVEILIFVIALLARCLYVGVSIQANGGDVIDTIKGSDGYYVISQNILQGNGFSGDNAPPYTPNSFRPPLQPYFLAATAFLFGGYWAPLVLLLLIGSIVPLLAMRIVSYLFESRKIAIATGILLAIEPISIFFSTVFYSEMLFMPFFLLAVLYAYKYVQGEVWYHGLFSAAFLGIATLVKAVTTYLPIVFVALFLFHFRKELTKKRIVAAVSYIAVFILVISPWLYRNYREFRTIGVTSEEGVTLYAVLIPSVLALENGTTYQQEYKKWIATGIKGPNEATVDLNAEYVRNAIPILLSHPVGLALLSGNTIISFFTNDGMRDFLDHAGVTLDKTLGRKPALFLLLSDPKSLFDTIGYYAMKPAILILVLRVFWFIMTILFLAGAVRLVRRQGLTLYSALAFGSIFYFALITLTVGLGVNARYRLPVELFIIPFALYELSALKSRFVQKRLLV